VRASAPAKINLALVVGSLRHDGKHELVTVYQRVGIADRIDVDPAERTEVYGFTGDTIVRDALDRLAAHAATDRRWRATIEKRVPVAAGLGGGSSDAATALRLANTTLDEPLPPEDLRELAAGLGADVPFFLVDGPQLGTGDGTILGALELPQDFWVVLVLPHGAQKPSTASVYSAFDGRGGADGFDARRNALLDALERVRRPRDLAALPPNDLASSPVADQLRALGAFRADVSGAGPAVYGLFHHRARADAAKRALRRLGRVWITAPAWYG
jgi:4-diphosphocytidyl-2-C-methyl-D-erythritol kinase